MCLCLHRASLVGGVDQELDPQYLEDWGTRGLAVDDCGVYDEVGLGGSSTPHPPPHTQTHTAFLLACMF